MITIFLFICFIGCATTEEFVRPGVDFKKYKRIAVLPFSDYPLQVGSGIQVADIVAMELLKCGIDVVDRSSLNQILNEQTAGLSGLLDESSAPKVGELLGVKGLMTGSINEYGTTVTNIQVVSGYDPAYMPISSAGITLKLIDTETGQIVWSASARGSEIGNNVQAIAARKAITKTVNEFIKNF